ncbi:hypothetical protein VDG1235_3679 [Verrucomicrobiia bacterium DG1235]|nr:hypothetical protein VDG1235_3679 [Verrucomicrobiae bacterium DG1235]
MDTASGYTFAMDLSPLFVGEQVSMQDFLSEHLERFKSDALGRIQKFDKQ